MRQTLNELVTLASFRTRMEAEIAAGVLEQNGIPFLIQSAEGTMIVPPPGGVELRVRRDDIDTAARLLDLPEGDR